MPIVAHSSYVSPCLLANGHIQTLLPSLLRRVDGVVYQRERIATPDGDFLDLDWAVKSARRLAVIAHGLEGDSKQAYALVEGTLQRQATMLAYIDDFRFLAVAILLMVPMVFLMKKGKPGAMVVH